MEKDTSFQAISLPTNNDSKLKFNKFNLFVKKEKQNITPKPQKKSKKFIFIIIEKIKNYPNISLLISNIIGMIFYGISLKGCYGGAENYCATVFIKVFKILAVLGLIDSLIIGITLVAIQKKIAN